MAPCRLFLQQQPHFIREVWTRTWTICSNGDSSAPMDRIEHFVWANFTLTMGTYQRSRSAPRIATACLPWPLDHSHSTSSSHTPLRQISRVPSRLLSSSRPSRSSCTPPCSQRNQSYQQWVSTVLQLLVIGCWKSTRCSSSFTLHLPSSRSSLGGSI